MNREQIINLSFAVYKVTDVFPKEEPLRGDIRGQVNNILGNLIVFQSSRRSNAEDIYLAKETAKNIENLKECFDSAVAKSLTKPSNFLVLQREYDKIYSELKSYFEEKKANPKEISQRQKEILAIIEEKKRVQLKEIQNYFSKVSKRTIQRDVVFLKNKGLIKLRGDFSNTFYELG